MRMVFNPIIRDISKIGHIQKITAQACQPDPMIWVEAYFSAMPILIYSLFKPDPFDLSSGRNGLRHSSKRKFKLNQMGYERAIYCSGGIGTKIAGFAGSIASRIGWYLLFADATVDLALNWTSMAYRWAGCRLPGEPWASCRLTGQIVKNNMWNRLEWGEFNRGHDGLYAGPDGIHMDAGVTASFGAGVSLGAWPTYPNYARSTSAEFRIVNVNTGWQSQSFKCTPDEYGYSSGAGLVRDWSMISQPGTYYVTVKPSGPTDAGYVSLASFSANGDASQGNMGGAILPDP